MGKLLPLNIRIGEQTASALCDFDSAMLLADAIDHSGCLARDDVSRLVRVGYAYAALRRPALGSAEMEGWSALMTALAAVERALAATETPARAEIDDDDIAVRPPVRLWPAGTAEGD